MPQQRDLDIAYLLMAKTWGERMSKDKTFKVGCLVVKDGRIISDGYNGTPEGFSNECEDKEGHTVPELIHAEHNAICKLSRGTESSVGATLYCVLSPCFNCAKLIIPAKIHRVVYLQRYSKVKSKDDGLPLLYRANIKTMEISLDPTALSTHSQLVKQAFV